MKLRMVLEIDVPDEVGGTLLRVVPMFQPRLQVDENVQVDENWTYRLRAYGSWKKVLE